MQEVYFQYPWAEDIYAVVLPDNVVEGVVCVFLPDGTLVKLVLEPEHYPICGPAETGRDPIYQAREVLAKEDLYQHMASFSGPGGVQRLAMMLNIAAAVNTLMTVVLTPAERDELENKGGLSRLEALLSPRAKAMIGIYRS